MASTGGYGNPVRRGSLPLRRGSSERMVKAFKNIEKQVAAEERTRRDSADSQVSLSNAESDDESQSASRLESVLKKRRSEVIKKRWKALRAAVKVVSKWQSTGINPNLYYPMSKSYAVWQAVMVGVTSYNMLICPTILAFKEVYMMPPLLMVSNLAIDALMAIHIRREFKTAYVTLGVTYDDEATIVEHYKKTHFMRDLIAALPLDTIVYIIQLSFSSWFDTTARLGDWYSTSHGPDVCSLDDTVSARVWDGFWEWIWLPAQIAVMLVRCRVLKLLHLQSLTHFFIGISNYTSHVNAVELVKLYLSVIWVGHMVGCAYYLICWIENFEGSDFVFETSFQYEPLWVKLLMTFYWGFSCMSGVSSTAQPPETPIETIFSFFVSLISISIYAVIIGNMGKIIKSSNHSAEKYRQAMERINNYMSYRRIPHTIQQRARQYFEFLHSRQRGYEDETILKDFPSHLRTEIYRHLCHDVVLKVPMFANSSKPFIDQMVTHLRPQIYSPGDFVVRIDEPGKEMFFISKGKVKVVNRVGASVVELGPGDFFGEIAVVSHTSRRVASVVAVSFCDLFVLNKSNLDELLTEFPDDAHEISHVARQRLRATSTAHMKEAADSASQIYRRLFGEPPSNSVPNIGFPDGRRMTVHNGQPTTPRPSLQFPDSPLRTPASLPYLASGLDNRNFTQSPYQPMDPTSEEDDESEYIYDAHELHQPEPFGGETAFASAGDMVDEKTSTTDENIYGQTRNEHLENASLTRSSLSPENLRRLEAANNSSFHDSVGMGSRPNTPSHMDANELSTPSTDQETYAHSNTLEPSIPNTHQAQKTQPSAPITHQGTYAQPTTLELSSPNTVQSPTRPTDTPPHLNLNWLTTAAEHAAAMIFQKKNHRTRGESCSSHNSEGSTHNLSPLHAGISSPLSMTAMAKRKSAMTSKPAPMSPRLSGRPVQTLSLPRVQGPSRQVQNQLTVQQTRTVGAPSTDDSEVMASEGGGVEGDRRVVNTPPVLTMQSGEPQAQQPLQKLKLAQALEQEQAQAQPHQQTPPPTHLHEFSKRGMRTRAISMDRLQPSPNTSPLTTRSRPVHAHRTKSGGLATDLLGSTHRSSGFGTSNVSPRGHLPKKPGGLHAAFSPGLHPSDGSTSGRGYFTALSADSLTSSHHLAKGAPKAGFSGFASLDGPSSGCDSSPVPGPGPRVSKDSVLWNHRAATGGRSHSTISIQTHEPTPPPIKRTSSASNRLGLRHTSADWSPQESIVVTSAPVQDDGLSSDADSRGSVRSYRLESPRRQDSYSIEDKDNMLARAGIIDSTELHRPACSPRSYRSRAYSLSPRPCAQTPGAFRSKSKTPMSSIVLNRAHSSQAEDKSANASEADSSIPNSSSPSHARSVRRRNIRSLSSMPSDGASSPGLSRRQRILDLAQSIKQQIPDSGSGSVVDALGALEGNITSLTPEDREQALVLLGRLTTTLTRNRTRSADAEFQPHANNSMNQALREEDVDKELNASTSKRLPSPLVQRESPSMRKPLSNVGTRASGNTAEEKGSKAEQPVKTDKVNAPSVEVFAVDSESPPSKIKIVLGYSDDGLALKYGSGKLKHSNSDSQPSMSSAMIDALPDARDLRRLRPVKSSPVPGIRERENNRRP